MSAQVVWTSLLVLLVLPVIATAADFKLTKAPKPWLDKSERVPPESWRTKTPTANPTINLDLDTVRDTVSAQFLSVTIDSCAIKYNWNMINFTSPRTQNLAKALSPAMLRIGGTDQDFLIFEPGGKGSRDDPSMDVPIVGDPPYYNCYPTEHTNFTLNEAQWDEVNTFVDKVGWDIIFGLNVLLRQPWPVGSWDSSNAKQMMSYTTSKGYKVNWELGNEPDLISGVSPDILTPEQLTKDFTSLKSLVGAKSQYIAGPDVAEIKEFYYDFLKDLDSGVINAVTWHHYYTSGRTAKSSDFTNASRLDSFMKEAMLAQVFLHLYQRGTELWLGETSSCSGGGAEGLSNAYIAGFMWLDKLGLAALTNNSRVFRQGFVGMNYSLLDAYQNPLPDYWLSVLYKKIVGERVIFVEDSLETGRLLRVYAHCAKPPYPSGSVVLLILNLNPNDATATLLNEELSSSSRDTYWLTPPEGNLTSHEVTLNGKLLQLEGDSLPALDPEEQRSGDTLTIPALSFGFQVFKDTVAAACT